MIQVDKTTDEWRALANAWSKEQLLRDFGSTLVDTVTPYDVSMYGPSGRWKHDASKAQTSSGRSILLRHLLNDDNDDADDEDDDDDDRNDDLMVFSAEHTNLTQLLLADNSPAMAWAARRMYMLPPRVPGEMTRAFVSVARRSQGLPFHRHGKTFTTLVVGTKTWLLAPPTAVPTPDMVWTSSGVSYCERKNISGATQVKRIVQVAGELLYLPKWWWHATLTSEGGGKSSGDGERSSASIALVMNVVDGLEDYEEKEEENMSGKESRSSSSSLYEATMNDPSSMFDAAREAFHFENVLRKIEEDLGRSDVNRIGVRQRWRQETRRMYDRQYERVRTQYDATLFGQRSPTLCLYFVHVKVRRIINRMVSAIEMEGDELEKGEQKGEDENLLVEDVLSAISECTRAVEIATFEGRLGTAARSSSLIQLADAVLIPTVFRSLSKQCYHKGVKQQNQWTLVPPLDVTARSFRKAGMRMLVDATRERQGQGPSIRAMWELASVMCSEEEEGEDVERAEERKRECHPMLERVLQASSDHGAAKRLWWTSFPELEIPKRVKKGSGVTEMLERVTGMMVEGGGREERASDGSGGLSERSEVGEEDEENGEGDWMEDKEVEVDENGEKVHVCNNVCRM